jgi:hypothetical protein
VGPETVTTIFAYVGKGAEFLNRLVSEIRRER